MNLFYSTYDQDGWPYEIVQAGPGAAMIKTPDGDTIKPPSFPSDGVLGKDGTVDFTGLVSISRALARREPSLVSVGLRRTLSLHYTRVEEE